MKVLWLESQKGVTGSQVPGVDASYKNYEDILKLKRVKRGELSSS